MRKELLQEYLAEQTKKLKELTDKSFLTAENIARCFNVKRNTISSYLNHMIKKGEVIKINSRPVYFIHKKTFEEMFHPLNRQVFDSFEQLLDGRLEQPAAEKPDAFGELVGSEGSLRKVIEQAKMAALYPGNGLPLILNGPTGVGKSYIAKLLHRFCVEKGVLEREAPFLVMNCAQYVNNPELLSAHLFGYVKGAFTGADKTSPGMLEAAAGGMLFLDEVHRLSPEGQEKLFTFMDTGSFRRLGESQGNHHARVRLVFATTMSLRETFLDTFLRRLPVSVNIPALEERGRKEKQELLYRSLIEEAKTLNCSIVLPERLAVLLFRIIKVLGRVHTR